MNQSIAQVVRESREEASKATAEYVKGQTTAVQTESPKPEEKAASSVTFKALSVDELGVITLIGGSVGGPNKVDLDKEFLDKAGLVKMAFDFCSDSGRTFKANHKDPLDAKLVQNWVGGVMIDEKGALRTLKADEALTDEMDVVGIDIRKGAESHWFFSIIPQDSEVVEIAKAGGISGASWGAVVTKTEV